jgi:hypothetical protein
MKTRIALLLGFVIAITPASVAAQADSSPAADAYDEALVGQLCAAASADEPELDACVTAVGTALTQLLEEVPAEDQSLLDQAASLVDDTLEDLRQIDLEAALDDAVKNAQEFELDLDIDVQGALDDVASAVEDLELDIDIDVQAALDEAVAEALAATEDFDLQGTIDAALAEAQVAIDEADLQGTVDEAVLALEGSVETAQAVVAEAQQWAQENRDAVCRGGSLSLGTIVGLVVFLETGLAFLATAAGGATERITNSVCPD